MLEDNFSNILKVPAEDITCVAERIVDFNNILLTEHFKRIPCSECWQATVSEVYESNDRCGLIKVYRLLCENCRKNNPFRYYYDIDSFRQLIVQKFSEGTCGRILFIFKSSSIISLPTDAYF